MPRQFIIKLANVKFNEDLFDGVDLLFAYKKDGRKDRAILISVPQGHEGV
jgi:hypothetical protein